MISTAWTNAPSDLLGLGGLDVPSAAPDASVPSTGLPTGARLRRLDESGVRHQSFLLTAYTVPAPVGAFAVTGVTSCNQKNSTTLGIHSSRRPKS